MAITMKIIKRISLFLLVVGSFSSAFAQTGTDNFSRDKLCSDKSAKIMILGVYHMDNPGQDAVNIKADDVLAPQKQREIEELIEKIARFKPTKVAIESPYRSTVWTTRYQQWLKGEYQMGRNEIEQLGFRLAKRFNHPALYPIDFPMWMNGLMPNERDDTVNIAPTPATPTESTAPPPPLSPRLAKKTELMRTASVINILRFMNSEEYIRDDHAGYIENLLPTKTIAIYAQADLLTNWYKRNLRMFTNINRITEFPNDRVLLIVGAGHQTILRDLAIAAPQYCLADTETYLN